MIKGSTIPLVLCNRVFDDIFLWKSGLADHDSVGRQKYLTLLTINRNKYSSFKIK